MSLKPSDKNRPNFPTEFSIPEMHAIKQLLVGTASDDQQKRALDWIIRDACRTYDDTYYGDSQRDSDFAAGKRFVGLQIVKILNINPDLVRRDEDEYTSINTGGNASTSGSDTSPVNSTRRKSRSK